MSLSTSTPVSSEAAEEVSTKDATLTVRIIKSFAYRTEKNLILHHVLLDSTTAGDLKRMIWEKMPVTSGFLPYLKLELDTLKIYFKAHEHKSQHLIINLEDGDALTLQDDLTLAAQGVEHETELSFYNHADYLAYKANPETKW